MKNSGGRDESTLSESLNWLRDHVYFDGVFKKQKGSIKYWITTEKSLYFHVESNGYNTDRNISMKY